MNYQNRYLSLCLLLFSFGGAFAHAGDDAWFCREGASERRGSVLLSCGVDTDATENGARKKALAAAFEELDTICDRSVDCKTYELQIDPQRNECLKEKGGYKCYRALRATITTVKRKETYAKGETLKQALEKIEITVKHEITGNVKGGGLGFYSVPSCEADIKPLSDALLDLSTQAKRDHVAAEAVKVTFSSECSKVHEKLLSILAHNKLTLPKYTEFVIKGLDTIPDPSEDYRASSALEYFHAPGQMADREWKASLSITSRAHLSWRLLRQLFYPEVTGDSEQALEKKRIDAFFSTVEKGEYGKPVAKSADEALAELLRAVTEHGKDRKTWLGLYAYARFRPALKYQKTDRLSDALQTLSQSGGEEKGRNWVNEWMAELSRKSEPTRQLSLSLEHYIEHFDDEVKRQDDEEDAGARNIKLARALKASFISKAGASLGRHLNVTYDDSDRRQRGVFCLKQGISCPDLVPDKERLMKLLRSKKANKRVEALEYLRWMPKVAQSLEEDLIVNLQEPAEAGLDSGEYMSRVHGEVIHVLAALPSPSVRVFRKLTELNIHVNDRKDRDRLQPGWEPQLMAALKHQNVSIRSNAARLLEYFDKLSEASCAKLIRDTKGREPTSYNDYEANVANHKCKGRGTEW